MSVAGLTEGKGNEAELDSMPKRNVQDIPFDLPGADLVAAGIAALRRGERTREALLVAVTPSRLRELGLNIPAAADAIEEPNLALYAAVCDAGGGYSDYNALIQRLVSFAQAAEWQQLISYCRIRGLCLPRILRSPIVPTRISGTRLLIHNPHT